MVNGMLNLRYIPQAQDERAKIEELIKEFYCIFDAKTGAFVFPEQYDCIDHLQSELAEIFDEHDINGDFVVQGIEAFTPTHFC